MANKPPTDNTDSRRNSNASDSSDSSWTFLTNNVETAKLELEHNTSMLPPIEILNQLEASTSRKFEDKNVIENKESRGDPPISLQISGRAQIIESEEDEDKEEEYSDERDHSPISLQLPGRDSIIESEEDEEQTGSNKQENVTSSEDEKEIKLKSGSWIKLAKTRASEGHLNNDHDAIATPSRHATRTNPHPSRMLTSLFSGPAHGIKQRLGNIITPIDEFEEFKDEETNNFAAGFDDKPSRDRVSTNNELISSMESDETARMKPKCKRRKSKRDLMDLYTFLVLFKDRKGLNKKPKSNGNYDLDLFQYIMELLSLIFMILVITIFVGILLGLIPIHTDHCASKADNSTMTSMTTSTCSSLPPDSPLIHQDQPNLTTAKGSSNEISAQSCVYTQIDLNEPHVSRKKLDYIEKEKQECKCDCQDTFSKALSSDTCNRNLLNLQEQLLLLQAELTRIKHVFKHSSVALEKCTENTNEVVASFLEHLDELDGNYDSSLEQFGSQLMETINAITRFNFPLLGFIEQNEEENATAEVFEKKIVSALTDLSESGSVWVKSVGQMFVSGTSRWLDEAIKLISEQKPANTDVALRMQELEKSSSQDGKERKEEEAPEQADLRGDLKEERVENDIIETINHPTKSPTEYLWELDEENKRFFKDRRHQQEQQEKVQKELEQEELLKRYHLEEDHYKSQLKQPQFRHNKKQMQHKPSFDEPKRPFKKQQKAHFKKVEKKFFREQQRQQQEQQFERFPTRQELEEGMRKEQSYDINKSLRI